MATKTKNTKFDLKDEALKPVFAGVGVTDLAVEKVRNVVSDMQKKVSEVQKTATDTTALKREVKAVPSKVSKRVDENRAAANEAYDELIKRGESLVERIRRQPSTQATAKDAKTTVSKAKTTTTQTKKAAKAEVTATKKTATQAKDAVADTTTPTRKAATQKTATAKGSAKATGTAAKDTATNAAKAATKAAEKVGN